MNDRQTDRVTTHKMMLHRIHLAGVIPVASMHQDEMRQIAIEIMFIGMLQRKNVRHGCTIQFITDEPFVQLFAISSTIPKSSDVNELTNKQIYK